jgi:hypothetical protein
MDSSACPSAVATGLSLLVDWANSQDHWIRALVAEVIERRQQLGDDRINHFYDLLLREKELRDGGPVAVPALSAGAALTGQALPLTLTSLKHVENVNALTPNQEIEFNPRMTVLFGENASGKTGYVRILKKVAAVRTAEPVLPNIRAAERVGLPRASIGFRLGEQEQSADWSGEQGADPLTRIGVFDARVAVVHLEDDLTYAYTPADLALFPLVHDGIERVGEKLAQAQEETAPKGNPFMGRFSRESKLYAKIEALGPSTDLADLEVLAEVPPELESTLPGLRETVAALRSGSLQTRLQVALRDQDLYGRLAKLAATLRKFNRAAYAEALARLRSAEDAHTLATRGAFASDAIPGVLGEAWRGFVEAAEAYIRENGIEPYPKAGVPCIYCRQPLGDAAVVLVRKYRDYCNDALRTAADKARTILRTMTAEISDLDMEGLAREVEKSAEVYEDPSEIPPLVMKARAVLGEGRLLQSTVRQGRPCEGMGLDLEEAENLLGIATSEAEKAVAELKKQAEDRERALAEESAKLGDLEDRITLRELISRIREYVAATRWADRARTYLGRFKGIKKGLTETSKRASAEVLNRDFERLFETECQALRAPRVSLDFPGREGEARRRKLLTPEHGLGEVLSEGEQKVIALADFLAEAALKREKSPIILDDPVTSLDHKRLQHVVDRLVALSLDRQIIVFTHDIWFAAELLARFEREPSACAFCDVVAEGGRIGCVTHGSHPRTDTFKDRARRIRNVIDQARKASGDTRPALIEKGYAELRGACEVVVEKEILKGVTERLRPNVRITVIDQIRADRLPAAVQAIQPLFNKCCRVIASHAQPLSMLGVRPTLDELETDWSTLQKARGEYLK